MNSTFRMLTVVTVMLLGLVACGHDEEPLEYVGAKLPSDTAYGDEPLLLRHHDSAYKILAVGNSFTINATSYFPWLINRINDDSICIARLTRSGCSLDMHWKSHINDTPDYDFYYSDNGNWILSDIKTIDESLRLMDWDVIVIQQVSGWSGLFYTYQPHLDNLTKLFRETNPQTMLAWHYTWAYTPWTKHSEFKNYDRDSEKMYNAIIEAGNKASENFDISIPSATLIKRMREEYPEVENGFSEDGYHIVDDLALYALSTLWYEVLINPYFGTSSLDRTDLPASVNAESLQRALDIIKDLTNDEGNQDITDSV